MTFGQKAEALMEDIDTSPSQQAAVELITAALKAEAEAGRRAEAEEHEAQLRRVAEAVREACKKECAIVRDSTVECIDPCTEDWIAQRMGMLDLDAIIEKVKGS